ncbi:MAG: Ig-like domain-containing protein, partial [Myxococcota bacterium]
INDAPIPNPVSLSTITGERAEVTLSATDPEGDALFYLIVDQPNNGTAVIDTATGVVTLTPDPTYTGNDVLVWQVTDGQASTNSVLPISISGDSDGDGIGDDSDNCPDIPNADQGDVSSNGIGDVCDCTSTPFTADLDPDLWASSDATDNITTQVVSETHAVRLNGAGAFVQTVPFPGCGSFYIELQVASGPPAPEMTDLLEVQARNVGDPDWTTIFDLQGTGLQEDFQLLSGQTGPVLDLSAGDAEFRVVVTGDELDDLFFIDDLVIACDEDADFLIDCDEALLEGFDLTDADPDGDGLIDADELERGTDPNLFDTDFDTVSDLDDNCPVDPNPSQLDSDGDGIGDACTGPVLIEDFETGAPGWTVESDWAVGSISGGGPGAPFEGNGGAATNLNGNYLNSAGSRSLTSPVVDMSNVSNPTIQFQMWFQIENRWDGALLEVSADGGTSWLQVPAAALDVPYTGTGNASNPLGNGTPIWTGTSGGNLWQRVRGDLSGLLPPSPSTVSFRWRFGADTSVPFPGIYLDNVYVGDLTRLPDN